MSYLFYDANGSVLTADSSVVSGSAIRPVVQIGSVLSAVPVSFSGSPSISGVVTVIGNPSISGTVNIGNIPQASVHGLVGASILGVGIDSGGLVVKPFVAESNVLRGFGSVLGAAQSVQLLAAGGVGVKTYLTDFAIANTGSVATLVTFTDGDASVLGYTMAPAASGSNKTLHIPMVTPKTNTVINMVSGTAVSVLYGWAAGFKA